MLLEDFAKYVIDNMTRATLVNALNITNKLSNTKKSPDIYNASEFLRAVYNYLNSKLSGDCTDTIKIYKTIVATDKCLKSLESSVPYNETMVIDSYIIEIWESLNGY